MPDYLFNLETLPPGEYKATISILKDGRKEIAVVTKTQPDAKISSIQVPFVISHCPLHELPLHGNLIDVSKISLQEYEQTAHDALHNGKGSILYDCGVLAGARAITQLVRRAPVVIPATKEESK